MAKTGEEAKLHSLQNLSEWTLPSNKDYLEDSLKLSNEISKNKDEQDFANSCNGCAHRSCSYLCPQR